MQCARSVRAALPLLLGLVAVATGATSPATARGPGGDGMVLLDDEVTVVAATGASTTTVHRILKPTTERGAQHVAKIVYPYRSSTETVRVVSAHRTTADGRTFPLPENACVVETPQPLADEHCYTDLAQLVLPFPGVRPGDTVEYVLEKDSAAAIPGHYSAFIAVADLWPTVDFRREVELPSGWGRRARVRSLGLAGLEPAIDHRPDGATVLRWEMTDTAAVKLERARQPIRQGGPGVWLSTLESWAEVGRWYADLVSDCDQLGPELKALVDARTRTLADPADIVRTLHFEVSNRVGFLGLELGLSSFCPRPAIEVWQSGFGDCKETANLLRAMLARAGVPTHLVLVNTRHAGRIETSVPSHLQFNHVLLAIPQGDGTMLFCDPTVRGLPAGELPPGVAGRPALLVENPGGRLIELPPAIAGDLLLDFDLTLVADGHLQGWLSLAADAYQSSLAVAHLLASSADGSAGGARDLLAGLFAEPEVLEVRVDKSLAGELPRSAALFFRARAPVEGTGVRLRVPVTPSLLPRLGPDEQRETPYFQHLGSTKVTITYRLPQGWQMRGEPPTALDVDTGYLGVHAQWSASDATLTARVHHATTSSLVAPAAWVSCVRAMSSLQAWLATPVLAEPGTGAISTGPAEAATMPRLTTGRAQLQLVDSMFPRDDDPGQRRAALRLVQKWFAGDHAAALEAGLEQAVLDQEEGRPERSVAAVRVLLEQHGAAVDAELRGWAEHLLAGGLRECGDGEAAREIYDRLSRQPDLSATRRGWASARAADLRLANEPLVAAAILAEALRLESPALEQQIALMARLEIAGVPGTALDARLDDVCARFPQRALDVHARLIYEVSRQLDQGRFAAADTLLRILERRVEPGSPVQALAGEVRRTRAMADSGLRCHEIAATIARYLEATPPPWWGDVPSPATGRDRLVAALQRFDREPGSREFVRGSLELLTSASVAPDFFTFLLRRSADHMRLPGGDDELLRRLEQWRARLEEDSTGDKEVAR